MSVTIGKIQPVEQSYSLLEAFGKYYRGESKNDIETLNSIFENAEKKIQSNRAAEQSIFQIQKSAQIAEFKPKTIFKKGSTNPKIIKQLAKPNTGKLAKNIFKFGRIGGGIAAGIGAAVGLYLLYKEFKSDEKKIV